MISLFNSTASSESGLISLNIGAPLKRFDSPVLDGGESLENPQTSWNRVFEVEPSPAGKSVTEQNAIQLAAVWRCVWILSFALAKTPVLALRETDQGHARATDHYLWKLFRRNFNQHLTAFRGRKMMQSWVCLWGNAYADIEINGRGQVVGLWPWRPDRVQISGDPDFDELLYTYTMNNGTRITLPASRILHLRGLELDGVRGLSPIRASAMSIGLAKAAEEYGARYFGNGSRPGGLIEHPGRLGATAQKNLRETFESLHRGLRGSHRLGVLEEGMKYVEVGIPPEDMQFLQTRQFQAIDIARLMGVPPHMIAELSRATFSNIEHQSIEFVQGTLSDYFRMWETEAEHSLLSEREADTISLRHDPSNLLKGDLLNQNRAYAIARQWGWMSANDILEKQGQNRIPNGDVYLEPMNMTPAGTGDPENDDPEDESPDPVDQQDPTDQAARSQLRRRLRRSRAELVRVNSELAQYKLSSAPALAALPAAQEGV
jgi:HK97 family phage portal protein